MFNKKSFFSLTLAFVFFANTIFANQMTRDLIVIDSPHDHDLNPHTASYSSEAQILTSLYEGLFAYDPFSLEPRLALAESFRISRDKLTWTFTIRKNAQFSNGDTITATDVYNSWKSLLNPSLQAPFASLLDVIVGAKEYREGITKDFSGVGLEAKNDFTFIVKLLAPTEHLSKILCHHAFSVVQDNLKAYSGAFVLDKKNAQELHLKKNSAYWDAQSVAIDGVQVLFSDDFDNNTYLFNSGKADWIMGNANTLNIINRKAISLSSQFGTEYLFFKTTNNPAGDKNFRNALVNAVPWETVRKDSIIKAKTLVLPMQGYSEVVGLVDQDLELAKDLLKSSSYGKKGSDEIIFAVPDDSGSIQRAQLMVDAWSEIGVKVKISPIPIMDYLSNIANSSAHIFSYIWIGDFADPLAFLELFRGDSTLNESKWKNAEFDNLLTEASNAKNPQQRYEKLAEAEQVLIDSGVIMPLSHTVSLNIVDFDVISGWYDNALDIHPFKYIRFNSPLPSSELLLAEQ
ncbi:MAG: peptide ABC transporter substrate-binding protein [Treponemataceae bacterium]